MKTWLLIFQTKAREISLEELILEDSEKIYQEHFHDKLMIERNSFYLPDVYQKKKIIKDDHFDKLNKNNKTERLVFYDVELPQGTLTTQISYKHIKDINIFIEGIRKHIIRRKIAKIDNFISELTTRARNIKLNQVIS